MKAILPSVLLLAVSAACMAMAVSEGDALIAAVMAFPLFTSVALIIEGRRWKVPFIVPVICAAACILATVTCLYALNWTESTDMSQSLHSHIEGVILWTVTFTNGYLILNAYANAADAVLNRILTGALTIFFSIGSMVLVWVFLAVFFNDDIDTKYFFSMEIAYLFVNGILSAVAGILITVKLKGRHWRVCRVPLEGSE